MDTNGTTMMSRKGMTQSSSNQNLSRVCPMPDNYLDMLDRDLTDGLNELLARQAAREATGGKEKETNDSKKPE